MPPAPSTAVLTTNLVGGLGNQLFLFANLLATSMRHGNMPMAVPFLGSSSSVEAPRPTYWHSLFRELPALGLANRDPLPNSPHVVTITETRPAHSPIALPADPRAAVCYNLVGFFQSERYFQDAKEAVVAAFTPEAYVDAANARLQWYVARSDAAVATLGAPASAAPSSSCGGVPLAEAAAAAGDEPPHLVAMHIRRGDYLRLPAVFHVQDHTYYLTALEQLCGAMLLRETRRFYQRGPTAGGASGAVRPRPRIHVLLFSEDLRYAQTLAGLVASTYGGVACSVVDAAQEAGCASSSDGGSNGGAGRGALDDPPRDVLELLMMAGCHDVVTANSSFSWWGAYLCQQPGRRVVAPALWFKHEAFPEASRLYPSGWLVL